MGKIKTKLIKRTGRALAERGIPFSEEFKKNKKILGKDMPSKKVRNQIAGFASRTKRQENIAKAKLEKSLEALSK